ncbi:MAG: hypothetical protein AVDCRST_MAG19-4342 [uncultured Thermomicrobiales bacterium]|uniref:RNA polymerase alpha subunit C-terminal domain-containing protein n=1 Tax=uncultured Thermomicrobiales bacterium TaxID=1645740 RepID=A0A6J4VSK0_9BACT|nr:MAG: hypothetical protein AVDCRST_MAG19-4342 [uncultured Thermomicrobiales bacterium]
MPPAAPRSPRPTPAARPEPGAWRGAGSGHADPFAVDPIRRSAALVAVAAAALLAPLVVDGGDAAAATLAGGSLGLVGLALGLPVLALSLLEAGWDRLRRRLDPEVDLLDVPPRLARLLRRHGYASIALVERTPDPALLLLPNLDPRALREVRRAIARWRYERWQAAGFP